MPLTEHLLISRDIFGCHKWKSDVTGIKVTEARHAAKHSTVQRQHPTRQNYPATCNVHSSEVEKTFYRNKVDRNKINQGWIRRLRVAIPKQVIIPGLISRLRPVFPDLEPSD